MTTAWLVLPLAVAAPPAYRVEAYPVKEVTALLGLTFVTPNQNVQEWVVAGPMLPELPGQRHVSTSMTPHGKPHPGGRVIAAEVLGHGGHKLHVEMTFKATLFARRLVEVTDGRVPDVPPLSPEQHKLFTQGNAGHDLDAPAFRHWLDQNHLHRRPGEGDVALARRVMEAMADRLKYREEPGMDRKASAVCRTGWSDCGGLSGLFVTAMRANGVPARQLVGRWAMSAKPGATNEGLPFFQNHCKAEFFARGVGWVPAEATGAVTGGRKAIDYNLGHDNGSFLTMSFGDGHEVVLPGVGKHTLGGMQGPAHWVVKGKGSGEGAKTVDETWTVSVRELDKAKK